MKTSLLSKMSSGRTYLWREIPKLTLRKQEPGIRKEWKTTTNKQTVEKKEKAKVEEVREVENNK